ncbi:hypothetical protein EPO17_00950 [Patescibacteria group bacterium]|nr:MAG: hypothetical protein EPO17_00950 [Patescibacteria group bacterium]
MMAHQRLHVIAGDVLQAMYPGCEAPDAVGGLAIKLYREYGSTSPLAMAEALVIALVPELYRLSVLGTVTEGEAEEFVTEMTSLVLGAAVGFGSARHQTA